MVFNSSQTFNGVAIDRLNLPENKQTTRISKGQMDLSNRVGKVKGEIIGMEQQEHNRDSIEDLFQGLRAKTAQLLRERGEAFFMPIDNSYCLFCDIKLPRETALEIKGQSLRPFHASEVNLNKKQNFQLILKTYIASQYPSFDLRRLPESANQLQLREIQSRFWEICLEQSVDMIIDLTNMNDMNKTPALYSYIPADDLLDFENLQVLTQTKSVQMIESETRKLSHASYLIQRNQDSKDAEENAINMQAIKRIHFQSWPDTKGLQAEDINYLIQQIRHFQSQTSQGKLLIHCRAGVGRTGTLITCLSLLDLIKNNEVTENNLKSVIECLVLQGREQRGPLFVQTVDQLNTIYEFGLLALNQI